MKLAFSCFLLLGLVACGGGTITPPAALKTVNDIVLTTKQLSVPLTTYEAGVYPVQSVMVGNSIYFGNDSNSGKPQFFVRYDVASNTFSSPLAVSSNVCGCGYSSKLVSDGVNAFYVANDATKYTASVNAWTKIAYPSTAQNNNGEAGVTYYNGNIYFVGGRTASNLFKYYNISQDKWFTAPNYLYATTSSEMAVYKDRIYVLGGQGAASKMAYFSTSASTWTALKDVPAPVSSSYGNVYSAVLGDDLYLLQSGSVYIYDLVNDVWATSPVSVGSLPDYSNLFSDGQKLYVAGQNSSKIPAVYEITVSVK
ncbi:hypothetical protein [Deinococcus sp.]|uniref:hypothetical protein n=1 Tax=Deinococcus sp. TaxID=47478 RepID=UPI003CC54B51